MDNHNFSQELNYLAIVFLEKLGNNNPSQADIDLIEAFLFYLAVSYKNPRKTELIRQSLLESKSDDLYVIAQFLGVSLHTVKTYQKIIRNLSNISSESERKIADWIRTSNQRSNHMMNIATRVMMRILWLRENSHQKVLLNEEQMDCLNNLLNNCIRTNSQSYRRQELKFSKAK